MASLNLKNVNKAYGNEVNAVTDFTMDIKDGEFIVIVGPSGCGKTTLLRMIAGIEEVESGEIYIGEKNVTNLEPKDRNISMVFQSYALFPHLSVFDNIAFGLKARKTPVEEIKEKVVAAAKTLDIEHLLQRKPRQLSGGERQRVAMGRAIVRNPNVFLMDEPLANLDALLRVQMRTELSLLHRRLQNTFVFVTHDQVEAMTLGDRIVVMKDGVIQQIGTPSEVYRTPANQFVAGFIGSPSMNFITSSFDGECIVGIRPEDIEVIKAESQNMDKNISIAVVELSELLGQETILHLRLKHDIQIDVQNKTAINKELESTLIQIHSSNTTILAKVNSDLSFEQDEIVGIRLKPEKIHYFDKKTGARILVKSFTMGLVLEFD